MTSSTSQPDPATSEPEQPAQANDEAADGRDLIRQTPPSTQGSPRPGVPLQPQPEASAPPRNVDPTAHPTPTGTRGADAVNQTPTSPTPTSAQPPVPSDDLTALLIATQADPSVSQSVVDETDVNDVAADNDLTSTDADSVMVAAEAGTTDARIKPISIQLTGAPPELEGTDKGWLLHESGRWIVGDPGRQLDIPATASRIVQTRPDLSVDWAESGALAFRAASIRGLGHFADGKPRQDACGVAFAPNNRWLVGCVADGVSAAKHAHLAADIAAATFTSRIGIDAAQIDTITDPETWPEVALTIGWQAATDEVSREITAAAEAWFRRGYERAGDQGNLARLDADGLVNNDARQVMATTAVVFIVATEPLPDRRVPFAVVVAAGDSEAMILSEGVWHPISAVKNEGAEIASSAVSPLPRTTTVEPIVGFLAPGQALAVITDGIGDPLGSGTGIVGRFLATRWSTAPDPIAFANDISFYRKSFVDDRTAVLVWVKD